MFNHTYLIVGVCSDQETLKWKEKTIMACKERAAVVRHCKWVDEVIEGAPYEPTLEYLDSINANLLVHDAASYAFKGHDMYNHLKKLGYFWLLN